MVFQWGTPDHVQSDLYSGTSALDRTAYRERTKRVVHGATHSIRPVKDLHRACQHSQHKGQETSLNAHLILFLVINDFSGRCGEASSCLLHDWFQERLDE